MRTFFVGIKGLIVKDGKVLLLKRSGERPFWDAPGGRIDRGENVMGTLNRELKEELPSITNVQIGSLVSAHVLSKNIKGTTGLTLLFYRVEADFIGGISLSDEHTAYEWMPLEKAQTQGSEGIPEAVALLAES